MKATLSPLGTRIVITPSTFKEEKRLKEFPALYKSTMPLDPVIVDFVSARLKKYSPLGIGTTKQVLDKLAEARALKAQEVTLHPAFHFHTEPLHHQRLALMQAIARGNLGLLLDPGLGKTKVVLDYIYHTKLVMGQQYLKSLIICPKALVSTWYKEALKHRPELKVRVVDSVSHRDSIAYLTEKIESKAWDDGKTRWAYRQIEKLKKELAVENKLMAEADVIVLNYSKAVKAEARLCAAKWSVCAVDEALIKDPTTERTKAVIKIGRSAASRLLLSGTLINQGPQDVFAPVQFLEPSIFGSSFYNFNKHYGVYASNKEKSADFLVGYRRDAREEIRKGLELVSLVMSKDEWLPDLPKKAPPVYFDTDLVGEQLRCYQELARNYITTLPNGETIEVDNPLSCLCKLQQISNGFVYYEELPDDFVDLGLHKDKDRTPKGPRKTYFFEYNGKNESLKAFLTNPEFSTRRFVLWYNMGGELAQIEKVLTDLKIAHVLVNGATKDSGAIVDEFNQDPSIRVFVAQAKSVNYGVTLLGTDLESLDSMPELDAEVFTEFFYSVNFSLEVFLQQMDRVHRIGVKCSPEYYFARANCSIEGRTYEKLFEKQLIRKEFLIDVIHQIRQVSQQAGASPTNYSGDYG